MIRFVDLRKAYWCWDQGDDPKDIKHGPFAFLSTIDDLFVEIKRRGNLARPAKSARGVRGRPESVTAPT